MLSSGPWLLVSLFQSTVDGNKSQWNHKSSVRFFQPVHFLIQSRNVEGGKKNKIINKIHTHQLKKPKKIKHKIIHPVIWLLQFPSSGRSVSNSGPSPSPSPSPHQCNEFRRYQRGVGDVHQRGEATHSRRAPKRCFHPEERTPTRPVSSFIHWFIHSVLNELLYGSSQSYWMSLHQVVSSSNWEQLPRENNQLFKKENSSRTISMSIENDLLGHWPWINAYENGYWSSSIQIIGRWGLFRVAQKTLTVNIESEILPLERV